MTKLLLIFILLFAQSTYAWPVYNLDTASGVDALQGHSNYTSFTIGLSGSNILTSDGNKPQITEGFTTFSTIFTPASADSIITLQGQLQVAHTASGAIMACSVFANGALDAVATNYVLWDNSATSDGVLAFGYIDKSFSAAARSYKIRCGLQSAGTMYINLFETGAALYGGSETSYLFIKEVLL